MPDSQREHGFWSAPVYSRRRVLAYAGIYLLGVWTGDVVLEWMAAHV